MAEVRRTRSIIIFSTIFAVFGVILVSGALFMVPYTVREQVRVDRSKTWANDTFVLMPYRNRTFMLDSIFENSSIIQVDVDSSDFIAFKIISDVTEKVWYEIEKMRSDVTLYWTPPSLGHGTWRFVFHNPSSTQVNVTAKITEFFVRVIEYQWNTYHRPFLDAVYGQGGILLATIGIALNLVFISRQAKK